MGGWAKAGAFRLSRSRHITTHENMIMRNVAFVSTDVDRKHDSNAIVINIGLYHQHNLLAVEVLRGKRTRYYILSVHRTIGMAAQLIEKHRPYSRVTGCMQITWPVGLAPCPGQCSGKHPRSIVEALTSKKASTSSRCSGRSFFFNA